MPYSLQPLKMKSIILLCLVTLIACCVVSCSKFVDGANPPPTQTGGTTSSDTSKTLIGNTSLVGNWNIVTDTVSFVSDAMYKGTASDHYIFTKYGNLYINSGFNQQVDTAVYSISTSANKVQWTNSYWSVNGVYSRSPTSVGAYVISNLTSTTLVLTQSAATPEGYRYEQITFKKNN